MRKERGGERDRGIQDKLGEREMGDGQQKQAGLIKANMWAVSHLD